MGKPVTVDSDDLEKIIMLTGAAKQIEQILVQRKGDPFLPKDEPGIKDAHDRVSNQWRRATKELPPGIDDPISSEALTLLRVLSGHISVIEPGVMKSKVYIELFGKLYIEYGNAHEIIYWSNSGEQQKVNPTPALVVRVSPRGQQLLAIMEAKGKSNLQ